MERKALCELSARARPGEGARVRELAFLLSPRSVEILERRGRRLGRLGAGRFEIPLVTQSRHWRGIEKSRGNPMSAGHGENCMSSVSPVRDLAVHGPTPGRSYPCDRNLAFRCFGLWSSVGLRAPFSKDSV